MLWGTISVLWAIEPNNTLQFLYSSLSRLMILIPFYGHLSIIYDGVEERIHKIIFLLIVALVYNAAYILFILDWAAIFSGGTLGVYTLTPEWPANDVGGRYGIAAFLAVYIAKKNGKIVDIIVAIPFIIIMVLSGSKGAMILFIMPLVLVVSFSSNNPLKMVRNMAIAVAIIYIAVSISLEVPLVYQLIGRRFENLFLGVKGAGNLEGTTKVREMMIVYGISWFVNSPIWGYGMRCYSSLLGTVYSHAVYSHNNYIEILVGTGLVGFVLYYSFYLVIIFKAIKNKGKYTALSLGLLLTIIVHDYAAICYNDLVIQICLMLCYIAVTTRKCAIDMERDNGL